jgi:hypothetical protein
MVNIGVRPTFNGTTKTIEVNILEFTGDLYDKILEFIFFKKIIRREPFHVITIVNLIVSTIAWIFALYFFTIEIKQWDVSVHFFSENKKKYS